MNTPTAALSLEKLLGPALKKRRVLLVDTSARLRDVRADVMRKLGMDVDCAADIIEARSWWRPDLYDLVLIHAGTELGTREKFCADVRSATPPQQLAFLVGKPEYLAEAPGEHEAASVSGNGGNGSAQRMPAALSSDASPATPQRWGILEACRRISEVRSVADARSRAMRDQPAPRRDPEARRSTAETEVLVEPERNANEESLRW